MDLYREDIDESTGALEALRGCARCKLYKETLPGCPHYCARWALAKAEPDRTERDRQIAAEHERTAKR